MVQDVFTPIIMWLQDTGILSKLRDDELNPPIPIPLPKVKISQPLSISQLAAAFLLAAAGIFISIMIFCGELFMGKRSELKGRRSRKVVRGIRNDNITQTALM